MSAETASETTTDVMRDYDARRNLNNESRARQIRCHPVKRSAADSATIPWHAGGARRLVLL